MPAQTSAVGMSRKLAAIFSADVQGYSRLMGEDEEATSRILMTHRQEGVDGSDAIVIEVKQRVWRRIMCGEFTGS